MEFDLENWFKTYIAPWFMTPGSYPNDEAKKAFSGRDDTWKGYHIFKERVELQNRVDRYESPNVPSIYEQHKTIFKKNMGMSGPEETYYEQKLDNGDFEVHIYSETGLPSGNGKMRIASEISTTSPPSGENNFAAVDYYITTSMKYSGIPDGIDFLPRIIAYPLNRFFRKAFVKVFAEEMIEKDGEYALQKTQEYNNYLRKYHGEEPVQSKTREAHFEPVPEEGVFFQ